MEWSLKNGKFSYNMIDKGFLKIKDKIVIGGGDTARAVEEMGYSKKMNHISTGGGASLTYLEGVRLKALESIDEK